jgi:hypothetical protein
MILLVRLLDLLPSFAAIKGLVGRKSKVPTNRAEMRAWLKAHPDLAEEARQGFAQIDVGNFTWGSRRGKD